MKPDQFNHHQNTEFLEFKFISPTKSSWHFRLKFFIIFGLTVVGPAFIAILMFQYYMQTRDPFNLAFSLGMFGIAVLMSYSIYVEIVVKILLGPETIEFTPKRAVLGLSKDKLKYSEIKKAKFGRNTIMLQGPKGCWETVYIDGLKEPEKRSIKAFLQKKNVPFVPFRLLAKKENKRKKSRLDQ